MINFNKDLSNILNSQFINFESLKNKTILITGGTGLIGYALIDVLNYVNKEKNFNLKVIALVRNETKANEKFKFIKNDGMLEIVVGDVINIPSIPEKIDYIIHAASQTSSKGFVNQPIETIDTAIFGTRNLLEIAKEKNVSKFIYLSSMEVYGHPEKGHKIKEDEIGTFKPNVIRNSYPISKIACENMCISYSNEYGVPVNILRLTQTFGFYPVSKDDNRLFAYFANCIINKNDISLKTKGETERCYLYTLDAVSAILTVMLNGLNQEIYNASNDNTYCSILDMANKVANEFGIKVRLEIDNNKNNGFSDTVYIDLDNSKLKELGWKSCCDDLTIEHMFKSMIF